MKNVGYILTDYPRLAMTFISGEIDAVAQSGWTVFPIAMNAPSPDEIATPEARARRDRTLYLKASKARLAGAFAAEAAAHPVAVGKLVVTALRSAGSDLGQAGRRLVHLAYAALVARYCREHRIGHLHAHFATAPSTIAWFATELLNVGGADPVRWSFTLHGPHDFFDEKIARMDLKAETASFVACISDFARSQLCRIAAPRLWHKFAVIRCGIVLDRFPQRAVRPIGQPPRIVTVGRIAPEKGHIVLVQALRQLAGQGIDAELEIIGNGPFRAAIRDEAERLGIADRVIFAGELPPAVVSERLALADIFCMASFAEGLPISIMEAMAVGVPVVTTWISGIPELAVNEATAMTVPPGNAMAVATALRRIIEDAGLRARLVAAARAAVAAQHCQARNMAALARLFDDRSAVAGDAAARPAALAFEQTP